MPSPTTAEFIGLIRKSGLIDEETLASVALGLPREPRACADALVEAELLTAFQAKQLLAGRLRGLVLGPYRILGPLGKGGMGVVYLAEHAALKRKVAVKVLGEEQSREKLALERFFREARAAAALDHPNIVRLHDIAQSHGMHYLVMEFVDGTDLQALIDQTGTLHAGQAANYIAQAAAGLQHAHDRGFIHRDIKPANLIVAKTGTVKVLDMGLARSVVNPKDELTGQLDEDVITGTADFLSPEQALNVRLDLRTDIYSLGGTFYTLLTGRPPYEGSTSQKLTQHQTAAPPDVRAVRSDVPVELAVVIAKMMAKQPRERYQTAGEVIAALVPWTPGIDLDSKESVAVTSDTTRTDLREPGRADPARVPDPRATRTRFVVVVGALACAAALLSAVLLYAVFGGTPKPSTVDSPPPAAPPPAAPQPVAPQPVSPAPADKLIYAFDFTGIRPFKYEYRDGEPGDPDWRSRVPNGVYLRCWKVESVAEFRGEVEADRPWIGVTNLNADWSCQMIFQFDDGLTLSLPPGKRYRVRAEYRTTGEAEGRVYIQNPKNGEFPSILEVQLEPTEGQWKFMDITVRRPPEGRIDVLFVNTTVGAGNTLAVRGLEVYETEPAR